MSAISNVGAKKWENTIRDIQKKSYWVIGLLLLGFSAYFYYTGLNRPVAGSLWFVGGFLIFYYYWIKWFVLDQPLDPDFNTASGACPDYLSVIPNNSGLYTPTSKTQYFCVDFVGVSRNGGIRRANPKNIRAEIADPSYRFSVDPEVDFKTATAKAAFLRRLQMAGLSYNSIGDDSLPTMGTYSNNAPVFNVTSTVVPPVPGGLTPMSGSGGSTSSLSNMTFETLLAIVKENVSYANRTNMSVNGQFTPAQNEQLLTNLISKGLVPAGTTGTQMNMLFTEAMAKLTQAQSMQIQAVYMS